MKRILVIGSGGAGKSTFSRRLGTLLDIEVVHLDVLYWHPGWVETPKPVWKNTVEELVKRDSWIMDGNYSGTLDTRLEACDTVIFLDLSRAVCIRRVLKRLISYRGSGRPDMAEGCREKFNPQFLAWVWGYPERTRPKVLKLLAENSQSKRVIRLQTQDEVERFLAALSNRTNKSLVV